MEDIIDIIVTETTNLIEITSQPTDEVIDVNIIDNREDITLNVTPSVVEININSLTGNFGVNWGDIQGTLSNQTDLQNTLNLKADLVGGKVPSSQLPSYVDDVVEVANYASLPATGETGKIYITLDTNYIYRWTGSTYVEIKDSSAVWGAITGTLSSQTDLQSALNAKEPTITAGTTSQYYRGDKTFQTLNTTAVTEGTNLYYTDARARASISAGTGISYNSTTGVITNTITQYTDALARAAISLTTTGSSGSSTYNSTTGVINVPTYTLAGLGGQPALSGTGFVKISGTTISYDNSTYALDSVVVKLTGDQTVAGVKTFSSNVIGSQFRVGTPFDTSRSFAAAGNQHTIALWLEEYTTTGGGAPDIFLNNGRGTISSKANIQVGDGLGGITWAGYVNNYFNGSAGFGAIVVNIDSTNNQANADITIDQSYNSATATNNFRLYANGGGLYIRGSVQGASFVKAGGTSSQFLKADGSIDSSTYLTTGTAASTYLPLSGGTLTGALNGTSVSLSSTLSATSGVYIPNGVYYYAKRSTGGADINVLGFASGSDTLNIKGGTSGGNISIQFQDTGGTIAAFYNGNFGVNTTSAAYKLDVNGTGNFAGTLRASHSTSGAYAAIIYNTSSSGEGLTIRGGSTSSHNSLIVQNYNGSTSLLSVLANGVTTHTAVDDSGNRTNPFNSFIITTDNPSLPYGGFGGSILFNNRSYTHGIVTTSRIRSVIYDDGANQGGGLIFETTPTAGGTLTPSITLSYDNFVLIGKTAAGFSTAGSQFQNSGKLFGVTNDGSGENIFVHRSGSNTGNLLAFFYNTGGVGSISTNGSTTSYNTTSDYRLKEDLKSINGLEIVNKIRVYDYKWKASDSRMDGVLAHELAEVLPYAVHGVKDGKEMQGVDYSKIVPVAIKAIQETDSKVVQLENKIVILEAEIQTLKNK